MNEQQQSQSYMSIFDRESDDQVRSPEKLNEYIRAATPGTWILAAALAVVLAALLVWGMIGTVPYHKDFKGVGIPHNSSSGSAEPADYYEFTNTAIKSILCLVDASDAMGRDLMDKDANATFRDGKQVSGRIYLMDTGMLKDDEIRELLDSFSVDTDWVFSVLGSGEYRYAAVVALDEFLDYMYWGESADVSVVVKEVHPIELLMS